MRTVLLMAMVSLLTVSGVSLAASDRALANAADSCNSVAYDTLKPQRQKSGARELMSVSANGKKYAKWMKKYIKLIDLCASQAYMPECKPTSKIENYHVKLNESKAKLEANMIKNYLCSSPLVNKFAADNTPQANVSDLIAKRVNDSLGSAAN